MLRNDEGHVDTPSHCRNTGAHLRDTYPIRTLIQTLPRLKPGGSGSPPATSGPCQGRYSDGTEILDGVGLHLAVAAIDGPGADGVGPIHVPMHPRAAAQAPKAAPARRGRLDVPTHTTRSGGIRLVDPLDHHPQPRRLLGEIAGDLSM